MTAFGADQLPRPLERAELREVMRKSHRFP